MKLNTLVMDGCTKWCFFQIKCILGWVSLDEQETLQYALCTIIRKTLKASIEVVEFAPQVGKPKICPLFYGD